MLQTLSSNDLCHSTRKSIPGLTHLSRRHCFMQEYPSQEKGVHRFLNLCNPLKKAFIAISINMQVKQGILQIYFVPLSK
uniref:Alternative protein LOC100129969 n=1 Tax=Homo sapiens TaxID=9606 RepID=L8EC51_HUMAN|nr:alternative protein LOC100129969 [Homo sapiens]